MKTQPIIKAKNKSEFSWKNGKHEMMNVDNEQKLLVQFCVFLYSVYFID